MGQATITWVGRNGSDVPITVSYKDEGTDEFISKEEKKRALQAIEKAMEGYAAGKYNPDAFTSLKPEIKITEGPYTETIVDSDIRPGWKSSVMQLFRRTPPEGESFTFKTQGLPAKKDIEQWYLIICRSKALAILNHHRSKDKALVALKGISSESVQEVSYFDERSRRIGTHTIGNIKNGFTQELQKIFEAEDIPTPKDFDAWRLAACKEIASGLVKQSKKEALEALSRIPNDTIEVFYHNKRWNRMMPYTLGNIKNGIFEALRDMVYVPDAIKGQIGPLTSAELEKIPLETAAGRFLHFVGHAKSIQDREGKWTPNLYDLILHSPFRADVENAGSDLVGDSTIKDWSAGKGFDRINDERGVEVKIITLPEDDPEFDQNFAELVSVLKKNTLTQGKDTTSLAAELIQIHDLFMMASDPDKNVKGVDKERQLSDPGGDGIKGSLRVDPGSIDEIEAIAKYMEWENDDPETMKKSGLSPLTKREKVYRLIAAYKTIYNYYKKARKDAGE